MIDEEPKGVSIKRNFAGLRVTVIEKDGSFTDLKGEKHEYRSGVKIEGLSKYPVKLQALQYACLIEMSNDEEIRKVLQRMLTVEKAKMAGVQI